MNDPNRTRAIIYSECIEAIGEAYEEFQTRQQELPFSDTRLSLPITFEDYIARGPALTHVQILAALVDADTNDIDLLVHAAKGILVGLQDRTQLNSKAQTT